MEHKLHSQPLLTTHTVAKIGILSAIAFVLMFFQVPLPFAPPFMQVICRCALLIGAFAAGPSGMIVLLRFLHAIQGSQTQFVGGVQLIVGSALSIANWIYHRNKCSAAILETLRVYCNEPWPRPTVHIVFPLYAAAFG